VKRWLAAGAPLLLAGCTVGPDFTRPETAAPATYGTEPTDLASRFTDGAVDVAWWQGFDDPQLAWLVDRLASQNLDLQAAAERIEQARAVRAVVAAQGLPHIGARATYERTRISENGEASLEVPAPDAPLEFNLFRPALSASWELDLFGRVRRTVEAANAQTEAAVEARHALALSAIADLAQFYFQLRAIQAQERIIRDNLALADKRRALVRNRFANGVATTLEVAQADAQGLAIAQDLPSVLAQEATLTNAIGLLLAEPPRTLQAALARPAAQPLAPPTVPLGLPADLTRRRPDVRQAEARLHAATAQTGVAVASFFPSVSLNGSFGFESLSAGTLFNWASRQFNVGPTVNLPIFEGGQLKGTLHLREAQQREAAVQYRRTVLQAWHDVDNALTGYAQAQHLRTASFDTSAADTRALVAADQQYAQGVTTLLDVVVAQEAVLRGQNSVVQAQLGVEMRLVDLFKALGGGWQAVPEPGAAPAPRTGLGTLLHYPGKLSR
jgi:NodT family efflux transporter outer membrane factor (OMF) lipoprotein